MIPFNINRPANLAQLQALYNQGDQDPAAIHAGLGSRGRGSLEASAQAMGINDPVAFFQKQRAMKLAAATPSLGSQLAAREIAGNTAMEQERAAAVAARGGNMFRTPLPTGAEAELSPLAEKEAASQKLTPLNYALGQRAQQAGVNIAELDPEGRGRGYTVAPTASDLYADKRFQSLHSRNPDHAQKLFSALTGSDLNEHVKSIATRRAASQAQQQTRYNSGFESGKLRINDKTGEAEQRQMIADPNGSGKLVESAEYGPLDTFHSIGWTPEVQRSVLGDRGYREIELLRKKNIPATPAQQGANPEAPVAPPSAAMVAALQSGNGYLPQDEAAATATPPVGFIPRQAGEEGSMLGEIGMPISNAVANLWNRTGAKLGGSPMKIYGENPLPANNETALSILQTPRFKAWQRANPAAAAVRVRELINQAYVPAGNAPADQSMDFSSNY
jgi:hypothetical protein